MTAGSGAKPGAPARGFAGWIRRLVETEAGAIETVGVSIGIAVAIFLSGVLMARAMGPVGRGNVAAHLAALATSFALGSLGVSYSAAFASSRSRSLDSVFRRLLVPALVSVALTCLLDTVLEALVVHSPSRAETALSVAGAGATQATAIVLAWIQGSGWMRPWNVLRLCSQGLFLPLLAIFQVGGGLSVATAVLAYALPQIAIGLLGLVLVFKGLRRAAEPVPPELDRLWAYGGLVAASSALYQVNQRLDQLFLSLFRRYTDLGVYASAVTLAGVGIPIGAGLAQATFAEGLRATPAARARLTRRRVWAVLLLTSLGALVLGFLRKPLMRAIYGAPFERGGDALAILAWGTVFLAGNYVATESLRSSGDARTPMWAEAIGAAITIGLLPLAISRFGLLGAAAVSTFSYLMSFLWNSAANARARARALQS